LSAIPSLVKWTGSKRGQARAIVAEFPDHGRYLEPFLGGGAVLYQLAPRPGAVAGDLYAPLVTLWQRVQSEPQQVIDGYERRWTALQHELDELERAALPRGSGRPRVFYDVRARFNRTRDPLDLVFLMRTCVNGIVRFNAAGRFNNSFHLTRRGMQPTRFAEGVRAWHRVLRDVELVCGDYVETLARARAGDLAYLDPPYAGSRNRYCADLDLARLFDALEDLNQRGVRWALSFDGRRGARDLRIEVPPELYTRRLLLRSGHSAVKRVLDGPLEVVEESLYLGPS
jgi:DNA adenine methylase